MTDSRLPEELQSFITEATSHSEPLIRARRIRTALNYIKTAEQILARSQRKTITQLREDGMTQAEVAAALGLSQARVSALQKAARDKASFDC